MSILFIPSRITFTPVIEQMSFTLVDDKNICFIDEKRMLRKVVEDPPHGFGHVSATY